MLKHLGSAFLCLLCTAFVTSAARACINDREIDNAEREFKSSYETSPDYDTPPAPDSVTSADGRVTRNVALGLGGALFLGAGALTFKRL